MATKLKAKYRIWYILIGLAAATLIKFLWSPGLFYVLAVGWVIAKAVAAIRKDKEIGYIATKVFWMAVLILILIPAGLNYSGQMAKDNPGHPVYSRLPGNPFESLAPAPKFTDSEPAKQVRNCVKVSQTDTIGDLTPGFKAEWRIPEHIVEYSDRDKNPFYSHLWN